MFKLCSYYYDCLAFVSDTASVVGHLHKSNKTIFFDKSKADFLGKIMSLI